MRFHIQTNLKLALKKSIQTPKIILIGNLVLVLVFIYALENKNQFSAINVAIILLIIFKFLVDRRHFHDSGLWAGLMLLIGTDIFMDPFRSANHDYLLG